MTNVIAHRGACKVAPQNTIPAFQKAIEMGADGFENDVHLTKDGFLVVCHNHEIDETSNGTGAIVDYTLEDLRKLDFGSYFSEEFAGTKIPTLDEFLDLCRGLKVINIEIKTPKQTGTDVVRKTIDKVKEFGLFDKLIISCFSKDILIECKQVDAKTRTGILYSTDCPYTEIYDDPIAFAKSINADAIHPLGMLVDEDYINDCHEAGLIVNPWTIDKVYAMERLRDWGSDGIITNYPDVARSIIK
jgi:glycerophosphoryl diester phosphodiesterase